MGLRPAILFLLAPLLAACGSGSTAKPQPSAAPSQGPLLNEWTPNIAVVFAQGKDPAQSYGVNVSVWPTNRVLCTKPPSPKVSLYLSKNNEPGELIQKAPTLKQPENGKQSFPSEEFNDVPASLAADPAAKYSLVAYIRGQPASNVWLHSGKAQSAGGEPVKPTGYGSPDPAAVDARIQIVFPHDEQGKPVPAKAATRVNVAVDVFQHGTMLSVPPDASYSPQLWTAQGNARLSALPLGVQKTTYTVAGQGYPRWVFNDVHVEAGQTYHFLATVGLLGQQGGSYPSIWTYLPEAHTAPKPVAPPACIP